MSPLVNRLTVQTSSLATLYTYSCPTSQSSVTCNQFYNVFQFDLTQKCLLIRTVHR